jgi:hypothetical protein
MSSFSLDVGPCQTPWQGFLRGWVRKYGEARERSDRRVADQRYAQSFESSIGSSFLSDSRC